MKKVTDRYRSASDRKLKLALSRHVRACIGQEMFGKESHEAEVIRTRRELFAAIDRRVTRNNIAINKESTNEN